MVGGVRSQAQREAGPGALVIAVAGKRLSLVSCLVEPWEHWECPADEQWEVTSYLGLMQVSDTDPAHTLIPSI